MKYGPYKAVGMDARSGYWHEPLHSMQLSVVTSIPIFMNGNHFFLIPTPSSTPTTVMPVRTSDVLLILIGILFPPAAAAILTGCSCALMLSILLTVLGYIPGHLYAFWLIFKKIQADERYGPNGSVYISQGVYQPIGAQLPQHAQPQQHYQQQPAHSSSQAYQVVAPSDAPKGPPPAYGTV